MSQTTEYTATVTAVTIHPTGENFDYCEDATTLRMVDETGGAFFLLSQEGREPLRLEVEELELLAAKARELRAQLGLREVQP